MELQEFIKAVDTFSNIGYEVVVTPHSSIDSAYNLYIYITNRLYFSYNVKNRELFIEDNSGVVFIKNCAPLEAVNIIRGFVTYF